MTKKFGVDVSTSHNNQGNEKATAIRKKIISIVAKYGLDDTEWAQAISSQYFLLSLSRMLNWSVKDYRNLMNRCLSSFNVTYTGDYILDNNRLLITPDETNRIVECMKNEDKIDNYYTHSAKMSASNIDSQQMYLNYHYGLLIKIVSSEDTEVLRALKHQCINRLLSENAVDASGGWYPYRVPWITARILISLKAVDFSSYPEKSKLKDYISEAIESLFQRIDETSPYWRSGVGEWVSQWESTALCLEALLVWDAIDVRLQEVERIIKYACSENNRDEWLCYKHNFSSEEAANKALSSIILASTISRITKLYYPDIYESISDDIMLLFKNIINIISKQKVDVVRQYCTIPQILYYVLVAIQ